MPGVDSSIYFQQQPLDIAGSVMNGLKMKDMMIQGKLNQQAYGDDQATRAAFKNNMVQDPQTGQATLNRQGVLNDLTQAGLGQKAFDMQRQWTLQDMQQHQAILKNTSDNMDFAAKQMAAVKDQAGYDRAKQLVEAANTVPKGTLPATYDPNFVNTFVNSSMSAKDQADLAHKDVSLQLEKLKTQVEMQKFGNQLNQQQGEAVKDTTNMIESARGDKAYQQAKMDLYAGTKFNSLVNAMGGPDKMNMTMVRLGAAEIGKMASGGSPTMDELHGLTPDAVPQRVAELAEKYNNAPTPANAAAFVKQLQTYSNSLMGDAKDVIKKKHTDILQSQASRLNDQNYGRLNQIFVKGLDDQNELAKYAEPTAANTGDQPPQEQGGGDKKQAPNPFSKLGIDPNKLSDAQRANLAKQAQAELARRKKVAGQ